MELNNFAKEYNSLRYKQINIKGNDGTKNSPPTSQYCMSLFQTMTTNMYVNRMAGWLEKIQESTLEGEFQQH
jgi:hypothetical protein